MPLRAALVALAVLCLSACTTPAKTTKPALSVAAASNLTAAFEPIAKAFTAATGTPVVYSYGSTAQLSEQIRNGAPFDVFASADTAHVTQLAREGKLIAASQAVYARGQLALWFPRLSSAAPPSLDLLKAPSIRYIAIANPKLAPYGAAAIQLLERSNLRARLDPKIVFTTTISMAKQLAATGNADAAITAYGLVLRDGGTVVRVDPSLYDPIDQSLGIIAATAHRDQAARFTEFVLGAQGQSVLASFGYLPPP